MTCREHVDRLIAQARGYALDMNAILDELTEYGVECIGVSDPSMHYEGTIGGRRIELALVFKAGRSKTVKADF